MKQKRILLPTIDDAKMFVAAATQCDFDIDVFYNRVTIDAKPWNRKRYLKRSFLGYPDTIVTWANCSRRE